MSDDSKPPDTVHELDLEPYPGQATLTIRHRNKPERGPKGLTLRCHWAGPGDNAGYRPAGVLVGCLRVAIAELALAESMRAPADYCEIKEKAHGGMHAEGCWTYSHHYRLENDWNGVATAKIVDRTLALARECMAELRSTGLEAEAETET